MPPTMKPLNNAELRRFEARRDLAAELLDSIRQMKAGKIRTVLIPAVAKR